MQIGIPFIQMRGGTSRGPFFLRSDLPKEWPDIERVLLRVMGSPDPSKRQIDGIGGGDSLSSKVAIISKSERLDADINYLLCQVHLDRPIVETKLNCGNMLAAVGPFALSRGLVSASSPQTTLRIFNENTGIIVHATIQTPNGVVNYEGNTQIDGVPGTAAPIILNFISAIGSKTGKLFPTGNRVDFIQGIFVTCLDVAVPMVIALAKDFGFSGYESLEMLRDVKFLARLESIRKEAAVKMGLGDTTDSVMPKICLISPPQSRGNIHSKYFDPFALHPAHAVSGALCLGSAALIEGTLASKIACLSVTEGETKKIVIEHSSGVIETTIRIVYNADGDICIPEASFIRTARPLMQGEVLIPDHVLHPR